MHSGEIIFNFVHKEIAFKILFINMNSGEIIFNFFHKEIASNFVHKFIKMHGFYMHVLEGHRLENVFFFMLNVQWRNDCILFKSTHI